MPAQAALSGTPASISARDPPQTVAIEDEPFDSRMSETQRTAYGKFFDPVGSKFARARSASAP